jgi:hypothetical protein
VTGEIIISDTISVRNISPSIYDVTASVMDANGTRESAKSVTVRWNSTTGSTAARDLLVAAYQLKSNPPEYTVRDQLVADIGTVIPG